MSILDIFGSDDLKEESERDSSHSTPKAKYCSKCGKSLTRGADFCGSCGTRVDINSTSKHVSSDPDISSRSAERQEKNPKQKDGILRIALHMKWCNTFFLSGISLLIFGGALEIDPIMALGGLGLLGVVYCMVAIELMVWKSKWKYVAIISLLLGGGLGIICFFIAYSDAKNVLKKSGYTIGILGPREITLSGAKSL